MKNLVRSNAKLTEEQKKEKLTKLKTCYSQLLEKDREEANSAPAQIQNLHKQCLLLYNLLSVWEVYISTVKQD